MYGISEAGRRCSKVHIPLTIPVDVQCCLSLANDISYVGWKEFSACSSQHVGKKQVE
jgi:hypothetical protein